MQNGSWLLTKHVHVGWLEDTLFPGSVYHNLTNIIL